MNLESILISTRNRLGPSETYEHFDGDLIPEINAAFAVLYQRGVGPAKGFVISDDSTTWNEFTTDMVVQSMAREYVYLSTKLTFDPPENSSLLQSMKERKSELEWRLETAVEFPNEEVVSDE